MIYLTAILPFFKIHVNQVLARDDSPAANTQLPQNKHLPTIWQVYMHHVSFVILIIILSLSPFLVVKETGNQSLSNLPKITQLVNKTQN